MLRRRSIPLAPLLGAMIAGALAAGIFGWQVAERALELQIAGKRAALKKLAISGGITPNQEVMDYLSARSAYVEKRYKKWLDLVTISSLAEAAATDSQLYFQQRSHEVQLTLERLAAARTMTVPSQLGFPKELPPSDTVPRLLVQLSLIEKLASNIFEKGVSELSSLKVEDPEVVQEQGTKEAFLIRLPVRVRLKSTLAQLMKILAAIEREKPMIDMRTVHIFIGQPRGNVASVPADSQVAAPLPSAATGPEVLDIEILFAQYLLSSPVALVPEKGLDDAEALLQKASPISLPAGSSAAGRIKPKERRKRNR